MKRVVKRFESKSFIEEVFDVLFFIPRKIHRRNLRIKYLEDEVKYLKTELIKTRHVCKEIITECETTAYGNNEIKIRRIKEIAKCG